MELWRIHLQVPTFILGIHKNKFVGLNDKSAGHLPTQQAERVQTHTHHRHKAAKIINLSHITGPSWALQPQHNGTSHIHSTTTL